MQATRTGVRISLKPCVPRTVPCHVLPAAGLRASPSTIMRTAFSRTPVSRVRPPPLLLPLLPRLMGNSTQSSSGALHRARKLRQVQGGGAGRRGYRTSPGACASSTAFSKGEAEVVQAETHGETSTNVPSEPNDTKETLIEETETVTGPAETLPFQSETAKLLRIVAHSLYTDKEVVPIPDDLRPTVI